MSTEVRSLPLPSSILWVLHITIKDIKTIKNDLAKRRPARLALYENCALSTKEAIMALAPEFNKMKSRGFNTTNLVEILREHKINVKGATLNKYLNELKSTEKSTPATKEDNSGLI